jgi:hypothetical protein
MKYAKILGLLAVAAAALMAFAGTASATIITKSTDGGKTHTQMVKGEKIHAVNEGTVTLDGAVKITCTESTVEGEITEAGTPTTETPKGTIGTLTFGGCNHTVTVLKGGTLEVHTETTGTNNKNGTLTSNGAEITVITHGIIGTIHCIYTTANTDIGRVTGSDNTGKTATLDIDSAPIKIDETSAGCGFGTAEWTGSYSVDVPDHMDID